MEVEDRALEILEQKIPLSFLQQATDLLEKFSPYDRFDLRLEADGYVSKPGGIPRAIIGGNLIAEFSFSSRELFSSLEMSGAMYYDSKEKVMKPMIVQYIPNIIRYDSY